MRINFTIAYIQYSLSNLCSAKLSLVSLEVGVVTSAWIIWSKTFIATQSFILLAEQSSGNAKNNGYKR